MNGFEIEKKIDIIEDEIYELDPKILGLLLKDKTTRKNILWCTPDYEHYGEEYKQTSEMRTELITRDFTCVIQPRASKSKSIRDLRAKKRAEVFTPSWICNNQNNLVDNEWFGRKDVFNKPDGIRWITTPGKIEFGDKKRTWKAYVDSKRLEITCGEAPYLISRYDTTTGEWIPLNDRIGLFDRKMRIVNENCDTSEEWLKWSLRALRSVYGYEFQGDSVLIARENLLYDYIDYYKAKFGSAPGTELLKTVANIIAWNIWQMDGLRCVVPFSCHDVVDTEIQLTLFDEAAEPKVTPCPGCEKNNLFEHNGIYCRIFDWTNLKKSITYVSLFKGDKKHGKI